MNTNQVGPVMIFSQHHRRSVLERGSCLVLTLILINTKLSIHMQYLVNIREGVGIIRIEGDGGSTPVDLCWSGLVPRVPVHRLERAFPARDIPIPSACSVKQTVI